MNFRVTVTRYFHSSYSLFEMLHIAKPTCRQQGAGLLEWFHSVHYTIIVIPRAAIAHWFCSVQCEKNYMLTVIYMQTMTSLMFYYIMVRCLLLITVNTVLLHKIIFYNYFSVLIISVLYTTHRNSMYTLSLQLLHLYIDSLTSLFKQINYINTSCCTC